MRELILRTLYSFALCFSLGLAAEDAHHEKPCPDVTERTSSLWSFFGDRFNQVINYVDENMACPRATIELTSVGRDGINYQSRDNLENFCRCRNLQSGDVGEGEENLVFNESAYREQSREIWDRLLQSTFEDIKREHEEFTENISGLSSYTIDDFGACSKERIHNSVSSSLGSCIDYEDIERTTSRILDELSSVMQTVGDFEERMLLINGTEGGIFV